MIIRLTYLAETVSKCVNDEMRTENDMIKAFSFLSFLNIFEFFLGRITYLHLFYNLVLFLHLVLRMEGDVFHFRSLKNALQFISISFSFLVWFLIELNGFTVSNF